MPHTESSSEQIFNNARNVDGFHWDTLNVYPQEIMDEADKLDQDSFPSFLLQKKTKDQFVWLLKTFKDNHIVFLDNSTKKVLAAGFSAPINLDKDFPNNGWEGTVEQIISDYNLGKKPNALVAFSASVSPDARGQGMGDKLLDAFVQLAKELRLSKLIVPARPSGKSKYPDLSMEEYINLYETQTGKHADPWIRAHQRHGGRVVAVGKNSHVVRTSDGNWPSVEQWQKWTGLRFPEDGEYVIPRGNAKLHVHDGIGEYREDCIWVEYDIS